MNADPAVVYTHADFAYTPGLLLTYVGLTPPSPENPGSIHACPTIRSPASLPGIRPKTLFRRSLPPGTYTPQREELARAMRDAGWSYVTMGAELGLSDKTTWRHLTGKGWGWQDTFCRVAELVGRPDLAEWARGQG